MSRTTSSRVAGVAFLIYMAGGIGNEILSGRATAGEGMAATLASVAGHATDLRIAILLKLLECASAFVLGVTLYGITRDQDHELATLGMLCRFAEGMMIGSILIPIQLELLSLANAQDVPDALGSLLTIPAGSIGAIFFAAGMSIFSYLMLRGRLVPRPLASLGLGASALLLVGLPLQLTGFFSGPLTGYQWLPEIAFTIVFALWLLIKGVK